jgi:uncharacterized lipoprotein YmbA
MMARSSSRRHLVAVFALLPALGACSTTPSPRLFTLAPRPGTPDDRFSGTIDVKRAELAKYLDRPEIVRYRDAYELSLSEYVRWGEGLGDMVTRVLVADLAQRLPRGQAYASSGPLTLRPPQSRSKSTSTDSNPIHPAPSSLPLNGWPTASGAATGFDPSKSASP